MRVSLRLGTSSLAGLDALRITATGRSKALTACLQVVGGVAKVRVVRGTTCGTSLLSGDWACAPVRR